jgi:porphyrinogen peroxidase
MTRQPGILAPLPAAGRYLSLRRRPGASTSEALTALSAIEPGQDVVALGAALVDALGKSVPGLRAMPSLQGAGVSMPAVPVDLWIWLRGDDAGVLLHRGKDYTRALAPAFELTGDRTSFVHAGGRDLTGYEDGTENPSGDKALTTAYLAGQGAGLDGSSFVAVQTWRHDLEQFAAWSAERRDATIGRRIVDNEEIADAPASAHVKRTAQEDFEPEAFVLRRSMPWADSRGEGLVFVAFAHTLDAFEAQMRRMLGLDDGIVDALFGFTQPIDGAYGWCPPLRDGRLDLSALG